VEPKTPDLDDYGGISGFSSLALAGHDYDSDAENGHPNVSCVHTATHYNTLQLTATHCNALQCTATHYNTLQHTALHCNALQHTPLHCNTLQHTATHRNTQCELQHTHT